MPLIDTHCHLTHELFKKDIDQVIARAKAVGFGALIVSGVNPPTNRDVLRFVKKDPILKASLGIYPLDALGLTPDTTGLPHHPGMIDIDTEFAFFKKHRDEITAIGEVGMDRKFTKEHDEQQKANFRKIIGHTEKLGRPIIVHTRNAEADCLELLQSSTIKQVILHTFEGNRKLIQKAIELGYSFSVPTLLMRSSHFQMLVGMAPLEQLFTETDAPWLAADKEKRNEPAFITESIKKIAEIKKLGASEVEEQIWKNAKKVFGFG